MSRNSSVKFVTAGSYFNWKSRTTKQFSHTQLEKRKSQEEHNIQPAKVVVEDLFRESEDRELGNVNMEPSNVNELNNMEPPNDNVLDSLSVEHIERVLAEVDPNHLLSIYHYLSHLSSDPLVKEYMDILINIKLIPRLPKDFMEHSGTETTLILNNEDYIPLVTNMLSYFQSLYFSKNLSKAEENNVGLFNPKYNFKVPIYELMPLKALEFVTQCKVEFVTELQKLTLDGSQFTKELLMLRNFQIIKSKFPDTATLPTIQKHILHYNSIAIMRAEPEFYDKYIVKDID